MKKLNIFLALISAAFSLTCIYFAFTKASVNVVSISLFIFVGLMATWLYTSNIIDNIKLGRKKIIKHVCYQIYDGSALIGGNDKHHYSFDTAAEAIAEARKFKSNPRSHNPDMSVENVAWWGNRTYIVKKHTHVIEEIEII
jgi:hypothetical protein